VLVQGNLEGAFASIPVSGYEIHMGQSLGLSGYQPFATVRQTFDRVTRPDGAVNADGTVMGTYLHGIFDNDAFRRAWLHQVRERFGISPPASSELSMADTRARAFDRLATVVREHLEMDVLYRMLGHPPHDWSLSTC